MSKANFTADNFTATKWDDAKTKARFANQFVRFVESDFGEKAFDQRFYERLSRCFGHIAHYNRSGFFATFFTSTKDKVRFLRMTLLHRACGNPAFTNSDVERALQSWLFQRDLLAKYQQQLAEETEAAERAELARLQAKYGAA